MRKLLHLTLFSLTLILADLSVKAQTWAAPAGSDGLWSTATNWSTGTVPAIGAAVTFNGTSTEPCFIDPVLVRLGTLTVTAAYTGIILNDATTFQVIANTTFSGGTFFGSSNPVGTQTFTGGTFNVNAGATVFFLDAPVSFSGAFNLNGGDFTGSNSTTTLLGAVNLNTAATFDGNFGSVIFGGTGNRIVNINAGAAGTFVLTNTSLELTKISGGIGVAANDVLVTDQLTLNNGIIGPNSPGLIEVAGDLVSVSPDFDGLAGRISLTSPGTTNFILNARLITSGNGRLIVNKPVGTTVQVTNDDQNLPIQFGINRNGFIDITSGTMEFPNGNTVEMDNQALTIGTNGTLISTSDNLSLFGNFTNNGSFDANGGLFTFTGPANQILTSPTPILFNNVDITKSGTTNTITLPAGTNASVGGTLQVLNGRLVGAGRINAMGNLTYSSAGLSTTTLGFTGAADQVVDFTGAVANWNGPVIVNQSPASTITLASPWTLDQGTSQTVTFTSGVIVSDLTNILTFGPNNTATGGSNASYVEGPVRKTGGNAFTFPVGNAGIFAPARITGGTAVNSAVGGASEYIGQYFHADPRPVHGSAFNAPLTNVSHVEYWEINKVAGNDAFVWLSYENVRSGGITNVAQLRIASSDGTTWSSVGDISETVNGVNYMKTTAAQTTYPPFTLASINAISNPLPVSWLDFTGRYFNSVVELKWSTAIEVNNANYTIERSADGNSFSTIGSVPGNGTTNYVSNYGFTDQQPLKGIGYYRIKQTDIDGKFTYSKTIKVSTTAAAMTGLRLFPNPLTGSIPLTLENTSWKNQKVNVSLYNAVGAIVRQEQVTFGSDGRAKINLSGLQKGTYFINTYNNNEKQVLPLIVQ